MDAEEMLALEARVSQRVREQTMEEMKSKIDAIVQERLMAFVAQLGLQVPNQTRGDPLVRSPHTLVDPSRCHSGG